MAALHNKGAAMNPGRTRSVVIAGALLGCGLAPALGLGAGGTTEVFRCITGAGDVELRQGPCDAHTQQQRLTVEDQPTGWAPTIAPLEPSARPPTRQKKTQGTAAAAERAAQAQAHQCWEKRQRLEEVSARLRHGYKAKQGIDLKRKRDYYEAYLDEFCDR